MGDIINVRQNADLQLNYALRVGPNLSTPIPGTIRYNYTTDRIEAYLEQQQPYNNSNWAPMSLEIASPTDLGGVKIGNNLTITSSGVMSAVAGAPSRQFQRVISVCQKDNTGDYTSIQDCLNGPNGFFGYQYTGSPVVDWTTCNGALYGLHNNTSQVDFPWPDASNLYIIQVSPGVYQENNETIRLPPYVMLQGDTTGSVVIRSNPTSDPDNGVMIHTSTGSVIERITVDMSLASTANNTTGILCDYQSNNTQLRDITIATTDLSRPKTGISLVGTENISISGSMANIYLAIAQSNTTTNSLALISAAGTQNLVITDADLSITGNQNTKIGIQLTDNTTAQISGSRIAIQELNQNPILSHDATGLIIQDSIADLVDCQISVLGLDNKDNAGVNQLCQGIRVIDTVAPPPIITPMGAATEFIHYNNFDDNDEIKNAAFDWQTSAGFKTGDYLYAVSPDLTSGNRGIFQIRGFAQGGSSSYTMQLDNSVSLDDQTFASGDVSFCKLNNIGLFGCRITSASQTIYVATTGGEGANYRIQSAYSTLDGQNPELGYAHFILTVPQQITVGLQDCDFLSLADACDSIKDATATKPYEVVVQPGLIIERRIVRIPSYVSVVGQGQGITILKFEQSDIGGAPYDIPAAGITNTAVVLGTDTQNYYAGLSRMSIQIPSGLNHKNVLDTQITGIRVATIGGARLTDIALNMDFSVSTPVDTSSNIKGISVSPTAVVLASKYYLQRVSVELGISAQGENISAFSFTTTSYAALTDCRAEIYSIVSLAGRLLYGIWSNRSKLDITSPYVLVDIDGTAPGGAAYGVLSTDTTITPPGPSGSITYSQTPVIIYGGQIRATGIPGDVLYSVFADYASTLFALNTAVQGTAASRNDLMNTYPNSLLKTYKCYYFSSDGTSFINVGDLDPAGNEMGGDSENLNVGDPVGVPDMLGSKNVQVGIRTGTQNQSGNRNTMLGVDAGRQINTGNNNVLLGYAAGNNMVASNTTLVGAFCGQNLTGSTSQEIVMLGTDTGSTMTSAQNSVVIGAKAALATITATGSTVIGAGTASAATGLTDTLIIGANTATGLSTSTRDILIGTDTAQILSTSTDNLVMGTWAAQNTTSMTTSVLLGNETGANRLTTSESVLVGFGAAAGNSGTIPGNTGSRNVVVGHQTAASLRSGSDNFIAGARAGSQITSGSFNTILGSSSTTQTTAAGSLTTGSYNFIAGTNTANSLTTGSKNVVLGSQSGNKLTTQTDTFILGYNSGGNLTNSTSIIIGNESGKKVSDGGALIIGHGSGTNAGGEDLLIIGHNCARGLTGARNTIIGNYGAGASNAVVLSGTDNVLIGAYAGFQLTTGSYNVLIGAGGQTNSTGRSLTAGSGNMIFGYQTAPQLSGGNDNLIFGKQAAYNLSTGSRNIFLGAEAGQGLGTGTENVIIGNEAGKNVLTGTGIVLIGNRAGYSVSGANISDNLFIGNYAGYSITTGSQSTIIGNQAGKYETTGFQNTYIGNFAAQNLSAANRNICVGYYAGEGIDQVASKNSEDNIILGSFAGQKLTSGYQNILIGTQAGSNIQARAKNIMIGPYVGAQSNASLNIFIGGTTANANITGRSVGYWANGNYNIVLGTNAGLDLASAERNIIMGFEAGEHVSSGSKNIVLGQMAGNRLTTGNNNILVGQNTGVSISGAIGLQTGNNVIAIGTRAGGNIGASVNDSILIGTEAGFENQVDNAICIGPSAGSQNMTGVGGISIGYHAGLSSVAAEGCISIGSNAGASFTGSTVVGQNISIGDEAALNNQGTRNIIIGAEAATNSSNASNVIVIGYQAGANIGGLPSSTGVNPDNSIVVGFRAAADGDIGADNIIVGTSAAQSVDNPRVFARNIIIGASAGRVSNLAVDSIVLGQAGQSGTGGVKNILMGSGAGAVLGNPAPIYPQTVLFSLYGGVSFIAINISYAQSMLFFNEGDMILIESEAGEYSYQTQIGGIINPAGVFGSQTDPGYNSITILVFTEPYPIDGAIIPDGATVRSLANLDTGNVGLVDESKSSGNSLVGEAAGGQITTGSKSVAFGTGALATNQIAKYNNAIGTEAAYYAISDNNTCLGTRAGYSIDLYDGLTYNSNSVEFNPNTNTITYSGVDGFTVPTDEFRFGTVFDIAGSTLNDGRYTVSSANSSAVIVNGIPKYEALGVPLNISAEDLRVNSATFTFDQVAVNGLDAGGIAVGKLNLEDQSRIYATSSPVWSALDNTNVFRITGSRYNDGVYYKATDPLSSSNSYVIHGYFNAEVFDSQVQITASSINSTDTITSGISFNDYQVDTPFYAFFGQNKGTYKIGNMTGIDKTKQSRYTYARPLSNCALVSSNISTSIAEDNIIFTRGIQQSDQITATLIPLTPTTISQDYKNHYSFEKYQIFGTVDIYTGNSVIYFSNPVAKIGTNLANADIYCIDCPFAANDKMLIRLLSTVDNQTFPYEVIRPGFYGIADDAIVADATNPMYLTHSAIKNLDNDVSTTFSNLGFIKLSSSYNMDMDIHTGNYLIDTVVGNTIILAADQVLPIMASNLGQVQILRTGLYYNLALDSQVKTTMVNDYLGMQPNYLLDDKISGTDIMVQTGSFNPAAEPQFTYTVDAGNNSITVDSPQNHIFYKLVAPCMVEIDSDYYLVIGNDYPFNTLKISPDYDVSVLVGSNYSINYNSISSHSGYTRFNGLTAGQSYELLGGGNNDRLIFSPVSTNAISHQSVYVSSSLPLVNYNTNYTVLGVYSPPFGLFDANIYNQITPRGYFKHMVQNDANLSVIYDAVDTANLIFNSPNAYTVNNINLIETDDIINIQGMGNPVNNGYFTVLSNPAVSGPDYYMPLKHIGMSIGDNELLVNSGNITINEFRTINTDMNFQALHDSYGNTTNYLRFGRCYKSEMSNSSNFTVANVNVTEKTTNYTITTWNNANITTNICVGMLETVPAEAQYQLGIITPAGIAIDNFIITLGTPVPNYNSNIILEQEYVNAPPIGYIHNYMYRDKTTAYTSIIQSPCYIFSSNPNNINWNQGTNGITGNFVISGDNITLNNIQSELGGLLDLGLGRWDYGFKDVVNKPFAGIKPGMLLNITDNNTYSANVMVKSITLGANGELQEIVRDPRFTDTSYSNASWSFATSGTELTIQMLNPGNPMPADDNSCAQLISDRYNFAAISNPSMFITNYTGSYVAKLPVINALGTKSTSDYSYMNNYSILFNHRKQETQGITEDDTDILKVLPYNIPEANGVNNKYIIDDLGDRIWIVPRNKLVNENPFASVLYFINEYWGPINIVISNSGETLTTSTVGVDFTVLQPGVIISLFGADQYAQIISIDSATQLTLNTSYNPNVPLVDGTYTNTSISVNIIGSINTATVNLAYFKPGQRIIISKTGTSNDGTYYTSLFTPTSPECIFIEPYFGSITTAYPEFGVIERAMFGYEIYPLGFNGYATTTAAPPSIYNLFEIPYDEGITSNTLATFKAGDQIEITSSGLTGTFTVPDGLITQPYAIPLDGLPDGMDDEIPTTITKSVSFRVIGKAISTTTDAGIVKFHYTDAQGNNIMIGSFTGQFAGATGLSIHNLFLGNKVGQTNQGSGNIFFGSETGFATDASQGATEYDNKLAIYKNNFIGVPSNPLIGGDFASGRVGVGTIDPDGKLLGTLGDRTLLVVDGKVRAAAFLSFTGTHFVILDIESEPVKPELGMILSSRGRTHKLGLLDNIVECQLSTRVMDKRVYGVYAGDEMVNDRQIAHCAAVGEGSILVSTINGEPENGDYLCSSPVPGLAQLQPDDLLHNYTVAKLIEDVNWAAVSRYISYEGREYKVALVACSYHCA